MRILLVNDDGIHAKGIISLAQKLTLLHDVVVVAPENEHSGASHALTFHKLLNYKKVEIEGVKNAFSVTGTPCDCVKFGVEVILGAAPDIVISGINNCCNIGTDVLYSGTVNASIEASMMSIKSIAVSLECTDGDYSDTCSFIADNLDRLISLIPHFSTILNINFPSTQAKDIMGVKVTTVGHRIYKDEYQYIEGRGYMITGHPINVKNSSFCDIELFAEKYITISPIKVDFNDYATYEALKDVKI